MKLETKPCYEGHKLKFSYNGPTQQYYLDRMWTCGPSVLIVFQWFQIQFSSNKKLLYAGLLSPKGLRIKILIVVSSNCKTIQSNFNGARTPVGMPSKCLKFQLWTKIKKKKKNGKDFQCPWTDLRWTMLVTWRLLIS